MTDESPDAGSGFEFGTETELAATGDRDSDGDSDSDPDRGEERTWERLPIPELTSSAGRDARSASDDGPSSSFAVAIARIRREPTLLLPFLAAGLVLTVLDLLRRRDPLPVLVDDDPTIGVEFVGYPTGVPETVRSLAALIDLKLPYLLWGIGLEVLALLAVVAAGTATIARTLAIGDGRERWDDWRDWTATLSARRLLAYLGLVALFDAAGRVIGSFGEFDLLFGTLVAVPLFAVYVRCFVAPAAVVVGGENGAGPLTALRRSVRATRGRGWSILALVLSYGLAAWLLSLVSVIGTALSTAVVGALHAVSAAVVWERANDRDERAAGRPDE